MPRFRLCQQAAAGKYVRGVFLVDSGWRLEELRELPACQDYSVGVNATRTAGRFQFDRDAMIILDAELLDSKAAADVDVGFSQSAFESL